MAEIPINVSWKSLYFFGDRTGFTLGISKWQGNRVLVLNGPMILRVLYKTTPSMGGGVSDPFRDGARLATNRLRVQKRVTFARYSRTRFGSARYRGVPRSDAKLARNRGQSPHDRVVMSPPRWGKRPLDRGR